MKRTRQEVGARWLASRTDPTRELSPTIILSSDFLLLSIGEYCAILHYKTFNSDGSRASLRSSCWVYSDKGQWELAFHQGTPEAGAV